MCQRGASIYLTARGYAKIRSVELFDARRQWVKGSVAGDSLRKRQGKVQERGKKRSDSYLARM